MKTVSLGVISVLLVAQAKPTGVPDAIAAKLKPITNRLKYTTPVVIEKPAGQFMRMRHKASDIKVKLSRSDFADKPYQANVNWESVIQYSKVYNDREKAEKSTDWLEPGKIPGKDNMKHVTVTYNSKLYYSKGEWKLDHILWAGQGVRGSNSTQKGDETEWSEAFDDPKKKKK